MAIVIVLLAQVKPQRKFTGISIILSRIETKFQKTKK